MQTSILSCICGLDQQLVTDPECGEIICSKCGLVSPDRVMESRAEWRTFDSEGTERARTGSPTSLAQHDMGLSTIIGKENKDSSGRQLDSSVSTTIQRLRTWDFRSKAQSSTHRSLIRAFTELDGLKDRLGLSDAIIEKTAYVYRKAQEKNLIRGRSTSAILAAAIYASCREMGASRTLKDIAAGTDVHHVRRKIRCGAVKFISPDVHCCALNARLPVDVQPIWPHGIAIAGVPAGRVRQKVCVARCRIVRQSGIG